MDRRGIVRPRWGRNRFSITSVGFTHGYPCFALWANGASDRPAIQDFFRKRIVRVSRGKPDQLLHPVIIFGWLFLPVEEAAEHFPSYFFRCTFAATFNRSAFSRMNPVASSWL